jgi:hypothetical protein
VLVVEASIKPFISLVWAGVVILLVGFLVTLVRRVPEAGEMGSVPAAYGVADGVPMPWENTNSPPSQPVVSNTQTAIVNERR